MNNAISNLEAYYSRIVKFLLFFYSHGGPSFFSANLFFLPSLFLICSTHVSSLSLFLVCVDLILVGYGLTWVIVVEVVDGGWLILASGD